MRQFNAEERFQVAVWEALDRLMDQLVPEKIVGVIADYYVDLNGYLQGYNNQFGQKRIVNHLKTKKVIEEIGEPDVIELGYQNTSNYKVLYKHHFRILKKFYPFYQEQKFLKKKLESDNRDRDIISTINTLNQDNLSKKKVKAELMQICEIKQLGEKERRFLLILADLVPHLTTSFKILVPTKNYLRLKTTVQKKLNGMGWVIDTVYGSEYKNYYQLHKLINE